MRADGVASFHGKMKMKFGKSMFMNGGLYSSLGIYNKALNVAGVLSVRDLRSPSKDFVQSLSLELRE